jgi:hypothetical protein
MNRFVTCTLAGLAVLALSADVSFAQVSRRGNRVNNPPRIVPIPTRIVPIPTRIVPIPPRIVRIPPRIVPIPPRIVPIPTPTYYTTSPTYNTPTPYVAQQCYQTVRYLRVENNSGQDLTVYVKLNPCDQPWAWSITAGQTTYLAVDNQPLTASAAYLWAESCDGRQWNTYKDDVLALVPAPYWSDQVGTYTCTFNP